MTPAIEKRCPSCKATQPSAAFNRDRSTADGLYHYCRSCVAARFKRTEQTQAQLKRRRESTRRWYLKHRQRILEANRLKLYGLDAEAYRRLVEQQQNACAICQSDFGGRPHVDHCHTTGIVRGLLCGLCNHGLGSFRDSPDRLMAAAAYLAPFPRIPAEEYKPSPPRPKRKK
jgi:hypothetical protein